VYYRDRDGSQPVDDFIETLPVAHQVVVDNQIARINMLTPQHPHLPFPHSSQIDGELRELPCHYGRVLYRVLYRRSRNLVILLHMFRKDRGTYPRSTNRSRASAGLISRGGWTRPRENRLAQRATMRRDVAMTYHFW
jgi:phage-related protein